MRRQISLQLPKNMAVLVAVMFFLFPYACAAQPEAILAAAIEKILGMGPARELGSEGHGFTSGQIDKNPE